MKSDAERGILGAWARRARTIRGWKSAEEAVEQIERIAGHRMRADYLRGIEAGSQKPGPDTLGALEAAYGPFRGESTSPAAPTSDITALVQAVADLTEQNRRLSARLEEHVEATTRMAQDNLTLAEYLSAVLTVMAGNQGPRGFDTAGAIRAAADDLQARRLASSGRG